MNRRTVGAVADGGFKIALGVAYLAGAVPLARLVGAPVWLMAVAGLVLLIGGGVELAYTGSRSMRTYTRLMIGYDSGWVLAALAGLLVAWRGGGAGGEVWMGYQVGAQAGFAVMLIAGGSSRRGPG
ncbi:hypothetical protein B9W68_13600 [Streptomyces sp. CS227]|uniref:hypothetical protein n=1 Tax=Streptomyces sp. CS227 TaxID=1982763 RepID=UPI000B413FD3|nr:hypothetical protein [Streptomyces sp. CS227]OWA10884.1 hypothetical protein B9W68_13600 [Streptomyces sp. CS227]